MIEKPILFSTPMVVAVMGLFKWQTRRLTGLNLINEDPDRYRFAGFVYQKEILHAFFVDRDNDEKILIKCPYGRPGDQLWIREAFRLSGDQCLYRADYDDHQAQTIKWKPSIHIFRKDSRTDLKNLNIRVERLNDISEDDAKAEGIKFIKRDVYNRQDFYGVEKDNFNLYTPNAYTSFMFLWDSINGKPKKDKPDCSWSKNPFVWIVEFKKL